MDWIIISSIMFLVLGRIKVVLSFTLQWELLVYLRGLPVQAVWKPGMWWARPSRLPSLSAGKQTSISVHGRTISIKSNFPSSTIIYRSIGCSWPKRRCQIRAVRKLFQSRWQHLHGQESSHLHQVACLEWRKTDFNGSSSVPYGWWEAHHKIAASPNIPFVSKHSLPEKACQHLLVAETSAYSMSKPLKWYIPGSMRNVWIQQRCPYYLCSWVGKHFDATNLIHIPAQILEDQAQKPAKSLYVWQLALAVSTQVRPRARL